MRDGIILLSAAGSAGIVILCGLAVLIAKELDAVATGNTGFLAASAFVLLAVCAGYIGTGFWLRRTGRI